MLDFNYASKLAFRQLLVETGLSHENAYDVYKNVNKLVWTEFENGEISAEVLRARRFDLFLQAMNWKGEGIEWNRKYLQNLVKHTNFMEGAQNLLQQLSQNYNLHIVTNGLKEVQRPRITKAKLDDILTSITVSDEIGSAKPQSKFFEIAFHNAGSPNKEEVLMIGDSYQSDIKGAHKFGLDSCWLNPSLLKPAEILHTYEIKSIKDLLKLSAGS